MRAIARLALPLLALALACNAPRAFAQEYVGIAQRLTPQQLREVGLTPQQVELLDRFLRASTPEQAPERATAETDGSRPRAPRQFIGLDDTPMRGRLKGTIAGWEPGTVFAFENGQVWKVLKGSVRLRAPRTAPEVTLVPGIAGRWFLEIDPDQPKARVYRID